MVTILMKGKRSGTRPGLTECSGTLFVRTLSYFFAFLPGINSI